MGPVGLMQTLEEVEAMGLKNALASEQTTRQERAVQANPPYSSSREITSRTRWALASLGSSWWQS